MTAVVVMDHHPLPLPDAKRARLGPWSPTGEHQQQQQQQQQHHHHHHQTLPPLANPPRNGHMPAYAHPPPEAPDAPHHRGYMGPPPGYNNANGHHREMPMPRELDRSPPGAAYGPRPVAAMATPGEADYHAMSAYEDARGMSAPSYAPPRGDLPSPVHLPPGNNRLASLPPLTTPYGMPPYDMSQQREPYSAGGMSYAGSAAAAAAAAAKRKPQRAAQACDSCRALKAKCDEGRPTCTTCKEKGVKCVYKDPPPKQADKTTNDIADGVKRLEELLERQIEQTQKMEQQLSAISADHHRIKATVFPGGSDAASAHGGPHHPSLDAYAETAYATSHHLHSSFTTNQPEATDEDEVGAPVEPGVSSMPRNHTTGATNLLLIQPIAELCRGMLPQNKIYEQFPMWQEARRGCIRIYGRGEGNDQACGYDRDPLTDHGDDAATPGSDVSSPAIGEEWGQLGNMPMLESLAGNSEALGMPDFDRQTVLTLVQSYKDHINYLHPLLMPSQLDALTESFLKSVHESTPRSRHAERTHAYPGSAGSPASPGLKRKRSMIGDGMDGEAWSARAATPFRTISSALMLMVLALGKICIHRGKIPEVHGDRVIDPTMYRSAVHHAPNGIMPSPRTSSPAATAVFSPDAPSPTTMRHPSRRTSVDGGGVHPNRASRRNIHMIPGMHYFALATDIIGNQLGGNTLTHAHVNVLAGLYHAQLARPLESYAHIQKASVVVQFLIQPKLERFKRLLAARPPQLAERRDNPLLYTYWTCLQLESDILAELLCPHSGLLQYDSQIPDPSWAFAVEDGFDQQVVEMYAKQLGMRRHLNSLHGLFYKPGASEEPPATLKTLDAADEAVGSLLTGIDMTAPPSSDILVARLRAKAYGAHVITYRPFVLKILEMKQQVSRKNTRFVQQISADFKTGIEVPVLDHKATKASEIDPDFLQCAIKGLKALVASTMAFDGLGDPVTQRLIVTNVWGTCFAQWGNCMCLIAAWRDRILGDALRQIVTRERLAGLVTKTIGFLKLHSMPSCALSTAWKLLETAGVRGQLITPSSSSLAPGVAGGAGGAGAGAGSFNGSFGSDSASSAASASVSVSAMG